MFIDQVKTACQVIKNCFQQYKNDQVAIAFNGGKDCMVLLHLTHAYLEEAKNHGFKKIFQAVYIADKEPFPSVEEFITKCEKLYNLNLITIQGI